MAEYVPTTAQIANGYAAIGGNMMSIERSLDFDRWLAAHDAEVAAKALREALDSRPPGTHLIDHIYDMAARIERGE